MQCDVGVNRLARRETREDLRTRSHARTHIHTYIHPYTHTHTHTHLQGRHMSRPHSTQCRPAMILSVRHISQTWAWEHRQKTDRKQATKTGDNNRQKKTVKYRQNGLKDRRKQARNRQTTEGSRKTAGAATPHVVIPTLALVHAWLRWD